MIQVSKALVSQWVSRSVSDKGRQWLDKGLIKTNTVINLKLKIKTSASLFKRPNKGFPKCPGVDLNRNFDKG